MPVQHEVLFKFKPDTSQVTMGKALAALRSLKETVPVIQALSVGETFTTDRAKGFTHCLIVTLGKKEDVQAYALHPSHVEVGSNYLKPIIEEVIAVDYEFGIAAKL